MNHDPRKRRPGKDPADDLFAGFGPPVLPKGLAQRVLGRARASARGVVLRRPLVDRLWESRPLWVAWAAGVVLLLGVQLMLASPTSTHATIRSARVEAPGTRGAEPRIDSPLDPATAGELAPLLARHPMGDGSPGLPAYGGRPVVSIAADSLL